MDTPLSGNIETLLGYKGKDLALMTDEELRFNFKDVFDFEKSLREAAGLIKAETPQVKDPDNNEPDLFKSTPPKLSSKEKNEAKRLAAIKELVDLQRELGMRIPAKVTTPIPTT